MSVVYHYLSPQSKGLFRGAIAQSGSAISAFNKADKNTLILAISHIKGNFCMCDGTRPKGSVAETGHGRAVPLHVCSKCAFLLGPGRELVEFHAAPNLVGRSGQIFH